MNTRARSIASLLAAFAVLLLPATAFAKEDGLAAMDAPISGDADPGSTLDVGWSTFMELDGIRQPFTGGTVFIRLTSPDGTNANEVVGTESPLGSGHFSASIVVPAGGIGEVTVGLIGEACMDGVCERSDIIFPFVDDPVAASATGVGAPEAAAPPPVYEPVTTTSTAAGAVTTAPSVGGLVLMGLAVLLIAGAVGLGIAVNRSREPRLRSTEG
jgi:hypothetical protein